MKDQYRPTKFGSLWVWHNSDSTESAGIDKCGRLPCEVFNRLVRYLPVQKTSEGIVKPYPSFCAAMRALELALDGGI